MTLPEDGPFKFTAADLAGNWRFKPRGSVETADVYKLRDDFNQFLAVGLPRLFQLAPQLQQQFAQNPKVAEALMAQAVRLYRMTDLQNALSTMSANPPMMPAMMPPGGMPGQPGPTIPGIGGGEPSLVAPQPVGVQ